MENKQINRKTDVTRRGFFKSTGMLSSGLFLAGKVNTFAGIEDEAPIQTNLPQVTNTNRAGY